MIEITEELYLLTGHKPNRRFYKDTDNQLYMEIAKTLRLIKPRQSKNRSYVYYSFYYKTSAQSKLSTVSKRKVDCI